jgi:N-methylhydantoinase A/oxoprolinase/acetone carboxylase beta subunit
MKLDRARAEATIAARVAEPARLDTARAAAGIHAIVNETMAAAGRVYVADKGKSPAALSLVVTGGAGPVHAIGLARRLGCRRVVVPPLAGVMSSLGLLAAPIAFERSRPVNRRLVGLDIAAVAQELEALAAEALALLPPDAAPELRRSADLRYHGQDHALEIPISGAVDATLTEQLAAGFVAAYEALYGKVDDDNPIEIAALRVEARQPQPPPTLPAPRAGTPGAPAATRPAWQHDAARFEDTPVYRRETLALHQEIVGPAIVEERESTTVIGRGDILRVHDSGALIIDLATPDREG